MYVVTGVQQIKMVRYGSLDTCCVKLPGNGSEKQIHV